MTTVNRQILSMEKFEKWEVIYDWDAENEDDLTIRAGEFVLVKDKYDHGWWFGVIERNGELHKGHFPKNYVKQSAVNMPPPPPTRPLSVAKPVENSSNRLSRMFIHAPTKKDEHFSLRSLQAFDDLIDIGVALEIENFPGKNPVPDCEPMLSAKCRVSMEYVALVWDASALVVREFSRGMLTCTLGANQLVKGLELALNRLKVGEAATITCAPSNAYGSAGHPPYVAPDSYIIFKVKIASSEIDKSSPPQDPIGPPEMLSTGISTRTNKKANQNTKKEGSLVLDA